MHLICWNKGKAVVKRPCSFNLLLLLLLSLHDLHNWETWHRHFSFPCILCAKRWFSFYLRMLGGLHIMFSDHFYTSTYLPVAHSNKILTMQLVWCCISSPKHFVSWLVHLLYIAYSIHSHRDRWCAVFQLK